LEVSPTPSLGSKLESDNSAYSSSESEAEIEEKNKKMAFVSKQNCIQKQKQPTSAESSSLMADFDNLPSGPPYTSQGLCMSYNKQRV